MIDPLEATARSAFVSTFGAEPTMTVRSPSRVELLGNHTDYNGGLVLAAAIDRYTSVVGRIAEKRRARAVAANFELQTDDVPLDAIERGPRGDWRRYVRGVTWAMQEAYGPLRSGFEVAIAGNVPLGAGLSSSASLQAALAVFLIEAGLSHPGGTSPKRLADPVRMSVAHTLKTSENDFVGIGSGLLDQFTVLFGREGYALTLDCRTLAYERLPLGSPAPAIVVCDSTTSRRLADGMYNRRCEECERVVRFYQARKDADKVRLLRDVSLDELLADWDVLDAVGRLRARHVLTENDRVRRGAIALKSGDIAEFGRLMSASHASSRDDFENSSPALDALIEAAERAPGFLGGKLSGAGWAGCTVNLVEREHAEAFGESVRSAYSRKMGLDAVVHVCHSADAASATAAC